MGSLAAEAHQRSALMFWLRLMALPILSILLSSCLFNAASQMPANIPPPQIEATVVAFSPFARLTILVGPPQSLKNSYRFHEDLLVRVEQQSQGLKEGQFVRLKYDDDTGAKPELPKELFTAKVHWRFVATRDDTCATNLETLLYYKVNGKIFSNMQPTRWAKPLKPVNPALVPCYIISSGGFAKE